MSISSSIYANYANKVLSNYIKRLEKALDPLRCDEINLEEIKEIIKEMKCFEFGE